MANAPMTSFDELVGPAEPMIKIIAPATPLYKSGARGITTTLGTKIFILGTEIPNVEKLKVETDYGDSDCIPRTTLTITVAGSEVLTEFFED